MRIQKAISTIVSSRPHHWVGDGFHVQGMISYDGLGRELNPFILLDYADPKRFGPNKSSQPGVGFHPHRGFETVTFAYEGEVTHKDSNGGSGTIATGDVQWMTAGSGIQHEERFSKEFATRGGVFEMIQLWVNLPTAKKGTPPAYQSITKKQIPEVDVNGGTVRVVAGSYGKANGPALTHTPMNVYNIHLEAGSELSVDVPEGWVTGLLLRKGSVKVGNTTTVKPSTLVAFKREGTCIDLAAEEDSDWLMFSGEPIDEPIVGYGPFVMNTQEEIYMAVSDYRMGRYGGPPL